MILSPRCGNAVEVSSTATTALSEYASNNKIVPCKAGVVAVKLRYVLKTLRSVGTSKRCSPTGNLSRFSPFWQISELMSLPVTVGNAVWGTIRVVADSGPRVWNGAVYLLASDSGPW
jgi:hypothetical protein